MEGQSRRRDETFFCLRRRRAAGCCEYEKVLAETCCNLTHARDHIERCGLWTLFCHCGLCVCVGEGVPTSSEMRLLFRNMLCDA